MNDKILGVIAVLVGVLLTFKIAMKGTFGLLLIAIILAVLAANRQIGRWGYAVALLLGMVGLSGALVRSIFFSLALLFKLAPLLIILVGVIVLLKAFGK